MSSNPQGTKDAIQRYSFIARTLIFIHYENQVLLLKGAPHKNLWANRYNGIGGHVEQGESIADSALREIEEEAGLSAVNDLQLRGVITIDADKTPGILIFLFTASSLHGLIRASDEGMPEWVDWRTLPFESMVEDLPILLEKLASMQPSDPLFFAHYSYDKSGMLSIRFADQ